MVYDVAVIGGGIVGLATTRELLRRSPKLRVANIEKEARHALHQTGHNSGVAHAGIYYRPASLRARLCVEGRRALERYCVDNGLPYERFGKLIVALREDEFSRLDALWERGRANGVEGLELLDTRGIREREPHCNGLRAIWSPATASVDFAAVARSYARDAERLGADCYFGRKVTAIRRTAGVTSLESPLGALRARLVIACAGLYADRIARMAGGAHEPALVPFRGDYLLLDSARADLVRGHIYPVPDPALPFLGVHFSKRVDGSVVLGPTAVLAFAREGYRLQDVNPRDLAESLQHPGLWALLRKHWRAGLNESLHELAPDGFVAEAAKYVPDIRASDFRRGPSGVRAQGMWPDGTLLDDFALEVTDGALHVRNAPSPAATSALAIAAYIVDEAARMFDALHGGAPGAGASSPRAMETFVEASWVLEHLEDARLRIVDTRSTPHGSPGGPPQPSGAEQYAAGHVPGAVHLDYADHLADPATPHAARVTPAANFARILGAAGIGDDDTIVAYDDGTVPYAARFVWMCRYYGHGAVHVLAGGLPAWVAAGGPLTQTSPQLPAATFTAREQPALRASREEVLAVATGRSDAQLLETQRDATYALRDRDIAGARRLSGSLLLEDARGGRIADRATIDALVGDLGLDRGKRTIVSCGSGVSASGAYLALLENGFSDLAVYDGSWMEWSHDNLPTVPKHS